MLFFFKATQYIVYFLLLFNWSNLLKIAIVVQSLQASYVINRKIAITNILYIYKTGITAVGYT